LDHNYEVYPLLFILGFWVVTAVYTIYVSANKIEVWFDKSKDLPPWDWQRVHDNYWKFHTVSYDPEGKTHRRLEPMEKLQDVLVEAAKKRGTRSEVV
jgi:hypothetical protein